MARKKKKPPSKPSEAYLISFGDTMTALLAFFITLNSLAEEQSGANLHSGTGSFVSTVDGLGFPGNYPKNTSSRVIQQNEIRPGYILRNNEDEEGIGSLPDPESNDVESMDGEQEQLQRFLKNMGKMHEVDDEPDSHGEIVIDLFDPIGKNPPYLPNSAVRVLGQLLPRLSQPDYEITVVVWATTPSVTAWTRAVDQSAKLVDEFAKQAGLTAGQRKQLHPEGRPWLFANAKRPIMSVRVTRKF